MQGFIQRHYTQNLLLRYLCVCALFVLLAACDLWQNTYLNTANQQGLGPDGDTVARINGVKISLKEFQQEVVAFKAIFGAEHNFSSAENESIKEHVIANMIDTELLRQRAENSSFSLSPEEFSSILGVATELYTANDTQKWLSSRKLSLDSWNTRYTNRLLLERFMETVLTESLPEISDRQIEDYYSEHKSQYRKPLRHEVLHLQVASKQLADSLHKRIKKSPSEFEFLVGTYSISLDKVTDGNMGPIAKGVLPIVLEKPIFALKAQERLSPVVESPFGFHIFYLKRIHPKQNIPLAVAKESIGKTLREAALEEALVNWFQNTKKTADIVIDREMLRSDKGF